jgi:hypothetical protein
VLSPCPKTVASQPYFGNGPRHAGFGAFRVCDHLHTGWEMEFCSVPKMTGHIYNVNGVTCQTGRDFKAHRQSTSESLRECCAHNLSAIPEQNPPP